jgi:hypothetical protein
MEANVIIIKCSKPNKAFGARVEKMEDGDWWRTWAFNISAKKASSEGYINNSVIGNLYCTEDYPGCPHCGTTGFIQCHKCNKLSCWNNEERLVCPWCGAELDNIVTATDKFNVSVNDY